MLGTRPSRRRERRPLNESALHWRLKRLCRYAAWAMGCWASAPEFALIYSGHESGGRNTVDMLAVGKVATVKEARRPGEPGYSDHPWAVNVSNQHYLGLIAFECKATLSDLRAGMVVTGAHKHYCVVPESLRQDALRLVPKHVGIIIFEESRGASARWASSIARGARRQKEAMIPTWCYTRDAIPPSEWTRLLLSMAVSSTNYAVRWHA